MNNMPEVKVGIVAVSRDCFPESLSVNRRKALVEAYAKKYDAKDIYECPICIVESEIHMVQALEDIKKAGCNALCVYLGNFGPEISETLLAKHFDGPKMFIAAAEETQNDLCQGRGDAYCGMLNASYNLQLRNVKAYIPEYPVGDAEDCADMIHDFLPIARAVEGLSNLKIISFGPRPTNFLACNAPIKQLYAQIFFQQIDLLDHRRRRNKALLRRPVKAPGIRYPQKGFQLGIVHCDHILSRKLYSRNVKFSTVSPSRSGLSWNFAFIV